MSVQPTPIRKIALTALSAASQLLLLIYGRSLRPSSAVQIHAGMICPSDSVWLNCYYTLSSASYIFIIGASTEAINTLTIAASTIIIIGSIIAIRDCTAISTSSS